METKKFILDVIQEAVHSGARLIKICELLQISRRTIQRWKNECREDARKGAAKHVANKLSQNERNEIIKIACSEPYFDLTPYEIVPLIAQNGIYLASESTFYRIFRENSLLQLRVNRKQSSRKSKPDELKATGPDQVYNWDITYMNSNIRGKYFYCYTIIDIWTRKIIGWEIHEEESAEHSSRLFKKLSDEKNLKGLHLHSDNGGPMKGATMLATLYSLNIIPSFSRPRVSNDSPYIESYFKTLKTMPSYPGWFATIEDAIEWMEKFVCWYNNEHLHSSIGYVTPVQRETGEDTKIFAKRNKVLLKAKSEHPERWSSKIRQWKKIDVVFLNPDDERKQIKNNAA
ncbi:MAG: IS3 family transposase [Bacteroidales bacterium]|nr:IS3 family transposase [Bacteroidales bacterium]